MTRETNISFGSAFEGPSRGNKILLFLVSGNGTAMYFGEVQPI